MQVKAVIAYLQKMNPNEECAFSLWTHYETDRLLNEYFNGMRLDYDAQAKTMNIVQDSDAIWDVAKQAVNDLLDGEL